MKMIHMSVPNHPEATLEGYILDCELSLGQLQNRPAVVICPGGGYVYCSPREAEPVALRYAARGFHAFILRYSVGWDAAEFSPLQSAAYQPECQPRRAHRKRKFRRPRAVQENSGKAH